MKTKMQKITQTRQDRASVRCEAVSVITIATHVPNQVSGVGFVCRKVGLRSVVVRGRPCFEPIVGAVILSTPFTRLANVLVVVVGGAG